MTEAGWLPAPVEELFGPEATADESYDVLTVDVPPPSWLTALETARDRLGCTYFDWLSAVDEPGTGFRVAAHVAALGPVRRLLLRTTVPHEAPTLPTAVSVYAGAAWHERETHEMFGVHFEGHPALHHLLLPETFEGHPLRKDFVLAARVAKAWPGAKEPGEAADHAAPKRRQMLPPGVPDPNDWGPLKGQLPPAPARPTRTAGGAAARGTAAADRPRRARTASQGSASQTTPPEPTETDTPTPPPARRTRTASEGSATQRPTTPRRARSASEGSATQRAESGESAEGAAEAAAQPGSPEPTATPSATARRARSASEGSATQRADAAEAASGAAAEAADAVSAAAAAAAEQGTPTETTGAEEPTAPGRPGGPIAPTPRTPRRPAPRSADAPWHHARPAFDEPEPGDRKPTSELAGEATEEPAAGRTTPSPVTPTLEGQEGQQSQQGQQQEPARPEAPTPEDAPDEGAAPADDPAPADDRPPAEPTPDPKQRSQKHPQNHPDPDNPAGGPR